MHLEFHQLDRRLECLRVRNRALHKRLIASLAETGQQTPIVVVQQQDRYLVIDGHQRIAALEQLGRDTVEAVAWEMSEAGALLLERSMRASRPETAIEQGWLLADMENRLGFSLEELARRFGRSKTWVASRVALVDELPQQVQQLVRDGKIAPAPAMRYLAPVARVNPGHCQRLAASFASGQWTTRQAARLYRAWRGASRQTRERIVAAPELFRKAQDQPGPLETQLAQIAAIVQKALDGGEPLEDAAGAARAAVRAIGLLNELRQRIEEAGNGNAEPIPTRGDTAIACATSAQAGDRAAARDLAAKRPPSAEGELHRRAEDRAGRKGGATPPADPRVTAQMQGQSRASP